jgi:chromosomal replication initiation ATPase DnaA
MEDKIGISPEQILAEVCEQFGVTEKEIFGKRRKHEIVIARHCLMLRLRTETNMSFMAIGNYCDRHYTTVIHAVYKTLKKHE